MSDKSKQPECIKVPLLSCFFVSQCLDFLISDEYVYGLLTDRDLEEIRKFQEIFKDKLDARIKRKEYIKSKFSSSKPD